jgi:hypothetical protein
VLTAATGPECHSISKASLPANAAWVLVAITATPLGTASTAVTPRTALALRASNRATLPPNTGDRAIAAYFMPAIRTSIPYSALPFTLRGVSRRRCALPISEKFAGDFSGTFAGSGKAAAAAASEPYVALRRDAACHTTPGRVVHSEAGTFHSRAAAAINIARAVAPA